MIVGHSGRTERTDSTLLCTAGQGGDRLVHVGSTSGLWPAGPQTICTAEQWQPPSYGPPSRALCATCWTRPTPQCLPTQPRAGPICPLQLRPPLSLSSPSPTPPCKASSSYRLPPSPQPGPGSVKHLTAPNAPPSTPTELLSMLHTALISMPPTTPLLLLPMVPTVLLSEPPSAPVSVSTGPLPACLRDTCEGDALCR